MGIKHCKTKSNMDLKPPEIYHRAYVILTKHIVVKRFSYCLVIRGKDKGILQEIWSVKIAKIMIHLSRTDKGWCQYLNIQENSIKCNCHIGQNNLSCIRISTLHNLTICDAKDVQFISFLRWTVCKLQR